MFNRLLLGAAILTCTLSFGQAQDSTSNSPKTGNDPSMPDMDMPAQMPNMKSMNDKDADREAAAHVMHSMEGHMDMGPHMKTTALRQPKPGDAERAQKVVETARQVSEKYLDYHTALADGFKIFLPNVPQKIYHFTNRAYAIEAQMSFNPEHPASLLYEKHGDDYKLVGVMYTAPKRFTEDDLDQRIPLSIAQWHEHVNFCGPPANMPLAEKKEEMLGPNARFGLRGSISTQEACDAAGGRFIPVVFNWMVHVYPLEKDQAAIWSVERQHGDGD